MRNLFAFSAVLFALFAAEANDCKILIDPRDKPMICVTKAFPGFGYVDDPKTGGEETVLEYRHSGAWILRTAKCDDATLEFLVRNRIRIVLLLDGTREQVVDTLKRISDRGFADAIAGFQLGTKADGGGEGEKEKWRAAVAQIAKRFPKCPVAIPAKGPNPPFVKLLADAMRHVTHVMCDLSDCPAPYKVLKEMTKSFAKGSDANLKRVKIWAIAPDRVPGSPESERTTFRTMSWKIHWLLSAYAVERVDAVLFNQPMKPDEFGQTLRYLGLAFRDHPVVVAHGESLTSDAAKSLSSGPDLDQDFEDGPGDDLGGADKLSIVAAPKACQAVAEKKGGDVEFMALQNEGRDRMCLVMVNTCGKRTKVTVDLKKSKSGNSTYRRMFVDPETKKVTREAIGGYSQPGLPFTAVIDPDCIETVTFIMTSRNYNQAGY